MTRLLCLTALLLACQAEPITAPDAQASAPVDGAPSPTVALKLEGGRFAREPFPEPDPAARALYRRGVDRLLAGAPAEAHALFAQIQRDSPHTRHAKRLAPGAPTAIRGALLGMTIATLAPVLAYVRFLPPAR